ncbi:amino acid permease [Sphingomonas ginkgonis]|uniref:Amino acid permease n=2 Tax=Sphingomonas ginkgonis TaxID=2315330 RepID=A0A3R9WUJ4_9SPHN|nr:amino acid permease [Sphingomonas ginkgonis]
MATKPHRPWARKPIDTVRAQADSTGMTRTLGPVQLILIGIGCIIGAGVYVMTGTAAANYAGPAVILSFALAGLACGLIGLCYAELSSVLPVSGASYTYTYAVLGEAAAWGLGWMLMFEFGLAGSALAVGFAGYLGSLLGDFGVHIPAAFATSTVQAAQRGGDTSFSFAPSVNLVAPAALAVASLVLIRGIRQSAAVNTLLVVIKCGVLAGFVLVGAGHVDSTNWSPFIPANEGGFHYGVPGILRAASILFFAYLGFEAVATAAAEARRPQRDVPVGILGALLFSTLIYAVVALVLTGLVPFRSLGVPDPIALAVSAIGLPVVAVVIKVGALTGLGSVLLVNTYGQSRILFAIAADGLLPPALAAIHPIRATPANGTVTVAVISAVAAALLPISLLADMVSIGTALVFISVAIAVIRLRTTHPDLPRPFKVPIGGAWIGGQWIGVVPALAILACLLMMGPVLIDIVAKAIAGDWIPLSILLGYMLLGVGIYLGYGRHHSALRLAAD